ncbi:hypothetical protein EVAR_81862_1 [Eumeta japonica]|uniref:PiggyBac transposable element-derived protein domain-containing protein n=1 Tax=Eumeta variegata TaxID=151549 RepID=A0A4C1UYU1_EUMVA|nr:hypothetical protein EVAR_81862_1 [Eumeta japonica]
MILLDIFDDDIMKEIVIETNRYAHQVIDKAKAVDICQFNTLEEYWRKDTDIELLCFHNIMSYDRYILLTKCLHFSDNDKQPLPNAKAASNRLLPVINRLLTVRRKKNNNGKSVDDCDERAEAGRSRVRSRGQKRRRKSKKLMFHPPVTSGTAPNPNNSAKALTGKTT